MRGTSTFQPKSGLVSNQANSSLRSTLGDTMAIVTSNASLPPRTRSTAPSVVATDDWRTVVARSLSATGRLRGPTCCQQAGEAGADRGGRPDEHDRVVDEVYAV